MSLRPKLQAQCLISIIHCCFYSSLFCFILPFLLLLANGFYSPTMLSLALRNLPMTSTRFSFPYNSSLKFHELISGGCSEKLDCTKESIMHYILKFEYHVLWSRVQFQGKDERGPRTSEPCRRSSRTSPGDGSNLDQGRVPIDLLHDMNKLVKTKPAWKT